MSAEEGKRNSHRLEDIEAFSDEQKSILKGKWLTTLEEIVGYCSSDASKEGLASELGISSEQLEEILDRIRSKIGTQRYEAIRSASGRRRFVSGVKLTPEQKQRFSDIEEEQDD